MKVNNTTMYYTPNFWCIGDSHGLDDAYIRLTKLHQYTLQIGDFGFNYDCLNKVDSNFHKIIGGNHENWDNIVKVPHYLGRYGSSILNGTPFFFVSGGYSIDWKERTSGVDFFPNEELSIREATQCCCLYEEMKPDIVISHEGPYKVVDKMMPDRTVLQNWGYPDSWHSQTSELLQTLLDIHKPKLWIYGHHHRRATRQVGRTTFRCVYELEAYEVKL